MDGIERAPKGLCLVQQRPRPQRIEQHRQGIAGFVAAQHGAQAAAGFGVFLGLGQRLVHAQHQLRQQRLKGLGGELAALDIPSGNQVVGKVAIDPHPAGLRMAARHTARKADRGRIFNDHRFDKAGKWLDDPPSTTRRGAKTWAGSGWTMSNWGH